MPTSPVNHTTPSGGILRGYDPTTGLAVSDGHVVLATAAQPREAAPTSGTFRGTGASSSIRTEINARRFE